MPHAVEPEPQGGFSRGTPAFLHGGRNGLVAINPWEAGYDETRMAPISLFGAVPSAQTTMTLCTRSLVFVQTSEGTHSEYFRVFAGQIDRTDSSFATIRMDFECEPNHVLRLRF